VAILYYIPQLLGLSLGDLKMCQRH